LSDHPYARAPHKWMMSDILVGVTTENIKLAIPGVEL